MNAPLSLVLLAAGRGSRFGGPKQLEPVGVNDEPVFAITAKQARAAGFSRLILVTTSQLQPRLEGAVDTFVTDLEVSYVRQDEHEPSREIPWGTGHAVAVCSALLDGPFGVANGDDLYGDPSFELLAQFLRDDKPDSACIISFELHKVLSRFGGVSRGICDVRPDGGLITVTETHGLQRDQTNDGAGQIVDGEGTSYAADTPISMNLWGLSTGIADLLAQRFAPFVERAEGNPKLEFQLPTELAALADENTISIQVVPSSGRWVGLTHRDELEGVRADLRTW